MTSGRDGHTLDVIAERVAQLNRRADETALRLDRTEQNVQALMLLPSQMTDTRDDIREIKASLQGMAKEWQDREQWLQQFRQQAEALQETRAQGIKSGMVTVIVLAVGFITTLLTVLAQVAIKAIG